MEAVAGLKGAFVLQWPGGLLMKSRLATEGDVRHLYLEPSNENWDLQGQRIVQAGLAKSAPHFRQFGVLDIGHFSMPGMADVARAHGYDPRFARIGRPIEVRTDLPIMVKAMILSGEGPEFEAANYFWKTLAAGMPWFPSVGGVEGPVVCNQTGCTIVAPLWNNIGMWNEPVNPTVKPASIVPFGSFTKALTAGSGTDASLFTGGRALQFESLDGHHHDDDERAYLHHAARFVRMMKAGSGCDHLGGPLTVAKATSHFQDCGKVDGERALAFGRRFVATMSDVTNRKQSAANAAA